MAAVDIISPPGNSRNAATESKGLAPPKDCRRATGVRVEVDTQSGALLESFCIVNFNVEGSSIALNHCISHNRHVYIAYWHTQFHRQLATFLRIQSAHGPKRSREQKRQRKRRKRPSRRPRPRSPRWVRWLTSLQACLRTKWPVRVLALPGRCKEQGAGMAHVS